MADPIAPDEIQEAPADLYALGAVFYEMLTGYGFSHVFLLPRS